MKIVISSNSCWNIVNFRLPLIKKLIRKRIKVIILAPEDSFKKKILKLDCDYINIKFNSSNKNFLSNIILLFIFYFKLKKINPDYFLSFTAKPNIYGSLASSLLNIKIINTVTGLGNAFLDNYITKKIIIILYKISFFKSYKVLFHNKDDLVYFIKKNIVNKKNSDVVSGSGINLKEFKFKKLVNKKKESRTFLFAGRLIKNKGINEFIEAAKIVKSNYPNSKFIIIGSYENKSSSSILLKKIKFLHDKKIIQYLGCVDNPKKYIEKCDCVVLPSYREGLSKTLLESSAIGRPMIVSNVPGCKDIVKNKFNGYLCKNKDSKSLSHSMIRLIKMDYRKFDIMGKNARKLAEKLFDEKIVINKYLDILK